MSTSTPSAAVQHEFGVIDLTLEIEMEKIVLVAGILKKDHDHVGKRLLQIMLEKEIEGFSSHTLQLLSKFEMSIESITSIPKLRQVLKEKMIKLQKNKLIKTMMESTKTDMLLCNFEFSGKILEYLTILPFKQASCIFKLRSRMFPTSDNFKGRWSPLCPFCKMEETDIHLFSCPGYMDITESKLNHTMYFGERLLNELEMKAGKLVQIYERLATMKE